MKTVRKILIVLIILYIAHPLFSFGFLRIFGYSIDFNFDDTHLGLFKPNVGSKVNTIFFSKLYRESDAIYNYKTPRYYFVINEFYQIENLKNIAKYMTKTQIYSYQIDFESLATRQLKSSAHT